MCWNINDLRGPRESFTYGTRVSRVSLINETRETRIHLKSATRKVYRSTRDKGDTWGHMGTHWGHIFR